MGGARAGGRLVAGGAVAAAAATAALLLGAGAARMPPLARGLASLPLSAQGPVSAALGREESRYRVLGLRAANPAQRFHAVFSAAGVTVASGRARVGLALSAYGRGERLRAVGASTPRVSANRVSYAHGQLEEWFANGPLGLEQGFDIAARPRGRAGALTLALTLSGDLRARLRGGRVLLYGAGASLAYGGLVVTDARGRTLPAWLALAGGRLLIGVDDRRAVYPLRVDPLLGQSELAAANGARGEEFGEAVAISGETIVVGTPNYTVRSSDVEQGAAYVFTKPAAGWSHAVQRAVLTARHGLSEELFGHSVAVSANTIVVGAPFRQVGRHIGQGAAYVFVKPASGWRNATQSATLSAARGAENEYFGESVAIAGATIVCGAPGRRVGANARAGAVDVFERPASGWAGSPGERAQLTASDGKANDALGISVAISGATAVAGADLHATGANAGQGAAYVFVRPASGWKSATQAAELTAGAGAGQAGELFAHDVAISANTIAAGAPDRAQGASSDAGAIYVFVRPASGWAGSPPAQATLSAADPARGEALGGALAISARAIVAGASFKDVAGNAEQGAVYVFAKPASGWASTTDSQQLTAAGGVAGDSLGRSVAIAGATIIAGAPDREVAHRLGQGVVYVFAGAK